MNYITRTENTHAKAGNLNNALAKTSSPYIVTFDADMIPIHDFLLKTNPFLWVKIKLDLYKFHGIFIILIYSNIIYLIKKLFQMTKSVFKTNIGWKRQV